MVSRFIRVGAACVGAAGLVWSNLTLYPNVGNIAGTILFGGLLAAALFWEKLKALAAKLWRNIFGRIGLCVFAAVVACGITIGGIFSANMVKYGSQRSARTDCVIILGCQVVGEIPSYMLQDRLNAALELLETNPNAICIASGGQGARESITEAEAMRRWLTSKGISEERIIKEEGSGSTSENLKLCAEILSEREIGGSITIVTNEFHQYRAHLYAQNAGITAQHCSAATSPRLILNYWLREWVGLLQFFAGVGV